MLNRRWSTFARCTLAVGLLLIVQRAAQAQPASIGQYVAARDSGCKVWNPHPQPGEDADWTGGCTDGYAEGSGRLQWLKNGKATEHDEGTWHHGVQAGYGSQNWNSGRYDGDLVGGEPQGQGVLQLQSGRYVGAFEAGKPNGEGSMTNLSGSYHGIWKDGCLAGDKRHIAISVPSASCR